MASKTKAEQTEAVQEKALDLAEVQAQIAAMLAEAKAEAEKIVADAKEAAEQISAPAAAKAEADAAKAASNARDNELVEIQLFKDNDKYRDDVFVAVNGENCLIQRGQKVKIKRKFANVLEQSLKQDNQTASLIDQKASEFASETAKYQQ